MKLTQNHVESIQDLLERGVLTGSQANVEMVKMARVKVVKGRIPAQIRKELNSAVKAGDLSHWKKDGMKPEVYFHPKFEDLAKEARSKRERETINALSKVLC